MKQHHNPQPSNTVQLTTKNCSMVRGDTPLVQPSYGIPGNWIGRKPENGGNATEPMHDIAPCLTKADQHGVAQPIPFGVSEKPDVGHCLRSNASRADKHESTTYVAQPVYEMHGQDSRVRDLGDTCSTVTSKWGTGGGNVPVTTQPTIVHGTQDPCVSDIAFAQGRNNGGENVMVQAMAVRRLTPKECERLQGFPDNYTDIKSKNKPTPDGPRYKALGNSMAVPVMRWIGERIKQYEEMA
jgi:DNA (cytosine-5)-methyltransferase 1